MRHHCDGSIAYVITHMYRLSYTWGHGSISDFILSEFLMCNFKTRREVLMRKCVLMCAILQSLMKRYNLSAVTLQAVKAAQTQYLLTYLLTSSANHKTWPTSRLMITCSLDPWIKR